jgi:rhodanese-related sulfurtransferase
MRFVVLLIFSFLLLGCAAQEVEDTERYANITEEDLNLMLANKDFLLLDVHIPEVNEHVEGTDAFIPFNAIEENIGKLPVDKNAKIVVYCRSGSMSSKAAQELVRLGYTNVYNVEDGIEAYRTAKDKEKETVNKTQEVIEQPDEDMLLAEKIIPSEGVVLNAKWNDLGPMVVGSGALNLTKFKALMTRNGKPLTEEQFDILVNGSNKSIAIDRNNSLFILDVFWAFGLVNKNPILENLSSETGRVSINNLASTGGWPLGNRRGGDLFSSSELLQLDEDQQELVESLTPNVYRPCCNNPVSFPDCNHGMAALGLAEWMAYQNATEDEIYTALLIVNSYWFPQTYIETAAYLEYQNTSWEDISPKEILSAKYSSASGYMNTKQNLQDFPTVSVPGGGCGI